MASMLLLFHCCPDPSSSTSHRPRPRPRRHHLTSPTALTSHLPMSQTSSASVPSSWPPLTPPVPPPLKRRAILPPLFCVSSAALLTAEPLQAPSTTVPLTYAPPPETDHEATLAAETFLTNEESDIAAAAAGAVALAREAAEMAKNAVQIGASSGAHGSSDSLPYEPDFFLTERLRLPEVDISENFRRLDASKNAHESEKITQVSSPEAANFDFADPECEILEAKYSNRIRANSARQNERRARRSRAAEKMSSANVVCMKSASSTRRKRASLQEVDYSDPLRYLRGTTSTCRLLTAAEELELSEGIQDLLKLEKLQEELAERYGTQPTFAQWASVAETDQKTLRKRLNRGMFCKDKMIKSNIRLVISIAKNFQGAGLNLQDLVQEGCRGLVRGAEKFDASKGFKFSTYAHWWIKQAVRKSLSDQSRTIRLPFHMVDATYRVREARKQLYSETGRYPNNEEIAEMTGLSMKRLEAVLLAPKAPRSLEQKIGISQNLKPSEVIADPDAETAEDLLMKRFMKQDLNKVLDSLNPREKQVIRWRFGLQDGRMKTLQEIGELMGVSRERIRQIESCAFRKLKNKKKTKNLKQYLIS